MAAWPSGAQLLSSEDTVHYSCSCFILQLCRYQPSQVTWDRPPCRCHWDGIRCHRVLDLLLGERDIFAVGFRFLWEYRTTFSREFVEFGRQRSAGMNHYAWRLLPVATLGHHITHKQLGFGWSLRTNSFMNLNLNCAQMLLSPSKLHVCMFTGVSVCKHTSFCHMLSLVCTWNWNSFSKHKIQCTRSQCYPEKTKYQWNSMKSCFVPQFWGQAICVIQYFISRGCLLSECSADYR